ncbi:heterokaryon incompatibility protein-domain-containing protein, partial [Cladorrhinum samala]
MRLINTKTLEFEEFVSPPPYAILSHTWGPEETSYQDFQHPETRTRQQGFQKILMTCKLAQADGLQLAWVDTCCIDKTSSAELSEAINSMFKWYQRAAICYAYLPGVQQKEDHLDRRSTFARSRWFTRGWTLQELIAPAKICFFGVGWARLGDKTELESAIHNITRIDKDVLRGGSLNDISVARRMSWASRRQTTREEDIAYCLMGIFDINMPMLYGEGKKAFIRLQEEIFKETGDESLFAWKASINSAPFRGIFADSPTEFGHSADIIPFRDL